MDRASSLEVASLYEVWLVILHSKKKKKSVSLAAQIDLICGLGGQTEMPVMKAGVRQEWLVLAHPIGRSSILVESLG